MKNILKVANLITILLALLLANGCAKQNNPYSQKETNFLGIVKSSPGSFNLSSPTGSIVHTDDLISRKNFSGDEISLFWGLVKIQDY
jgi:hypothetical protein